MTCYETLTIREAPPPRPPPASVADAPMAHHLVKWWRNKFRNGYKKFHLGTEGERTDTEELVGRAASQCSAPPDLLPSEARALLQPTSPEPRARSRWRSRSPPSPPPPACEPRLPSPLVPHAADTHTRAHTPQPHNLQQEKPPRLRFEELTCDVQVHEVTSRQQPLQFSFTLYDLDGHGRMTKDDIAGIVSTIYESVGKSVTVPHYGSKTIQVRLTVVPESPVTAAERGAGGARPKGRRRARRRKETVVTGAKQDCGDATDDERRSRLSVDDSSSCSGERRRPVRARAPHPRASTPPPRRHNAHKEARERRPSKKRSGSLQRRELLQIIQANMEKNRLSFQTSRKSYERVIHEEETPNAKPHRQRSRAFTVSAKPAGDADAPRKARSEHPGNNGYLDLAHTERLPACQPAGADSNLCRYDRYLHAVICSSATHANSGFHQKNLPSTPPVHGTPPKPHKIPKTHHKSRSHDVSQTPRAPPPEPRVLQIIFL